MNKKDAARFREEPTENNSIDRDVLDFRNINVVSQEREAEKEEVDPNTFQDEEQIANFNSEVDSCHLDVGFVGEVNGEENEKGVEEYSYTGVKNCSAVKVEPADDCEIITGDNYTAEEDHRDRPHSETSDLTNEIEENPEELNLFLDRFNNSEGTFHCENESQVTGNCLTSSLSENESRGKKQTSYLCEICKRNFKNKPTLKCHLKIHTGEMAHECSECGRGFPDPLRLSRHQATHASDTLYSCEICEKTFKHKPSLRKHLKFHTGERPHMCASCGKSFAEKSTLRKHQAAHRSDTPYHCEICQKGFKFAQNLEYHLRTHTGEKPHLCEKCGKKFSQIGHLIRHRLTHNSDRPYSCERCQTRFKCKKSLEHHQNAHAESNTMCMYRRSKADVFPMWNNSFNHGETPFRCEVCKKCFQSTQKLENHVRIHTGEKPYMCEECGKKFAQLGHLTTHKTTHSSETPYSCGICSKGFKHKRSLENHLVAHKRKNRLGVPKGTNKRVSRVEPILSQET